MTPATSPKPPIPQPSLSKPLGVPSSLEVIEGDDLAPFQSGNPVLNRPPSLRVQKAVRPVGAAMGIVSSVVSGGDAMSLVDPAISSAAIISPDDPHSSQSTVLPHDSPAASEPLLLAGDLLQQMGEQVLLGLNSQGGTECWIELHDRFLDGLRLKLTFQDGQLVAVFQPPSRALLLALKERLPELHQRLTQRGIVVQQILLLDPPSQP